MANREALRELQSRLASRLQAARTEGVQASWLAVESAGAKYLFPLGAVGRDLPLRQRPAGALHPGLVPGRGQPARRPVRRGRPGQLRRRPGARRRAPTRPAPSRAWWRSTPLLEVNCALLIDRLAGLRNLDAFSSSSEPPEGSPDYFGSGYTDANGAYWQEINLQALSQQPQFLSISA